MIKVIIEREIEPDMESTYEHVIKNTLKAILEAPGYLSGATYKDAQHVHRRFIITNWRSLDDWQEWTNSHERKRVLGEVLPVLKHEKISVLTA